MGLDARDITDVKSISLDIKAKVLYEFLKVDFLKIGRPLKNLFKNAITTKYAYDYAYNIQYMDFMERMKGFCHGEIIL